MQKGRYKEFDVDRGLRALQGRAEKMDNQAKRARIENTDIDI
jgi:hypothetical protein